jgi:hypothetical protein
MDKGVRRCGLAAVDMLQSAIAITRSGAASHQPAEAEHCYRPLLGRLSSERRGRPLQPSDTPPPQRAFPTTDGRGQVVLGVSIPARAQHHTAMRVAGSASLPN